MKQPTGQETVPEKLNQIAETGMCVWYVASPEELGGVVREAVRACIEAEVEAGSDEAHQIIGAAVVEHLSRQTSNVFLEMEIYAIELFHALMMVRMMCPEGKLINKSLNPPLYVDLDMVLGLKQPERFADLQKRLNEMLTQSAHVDKLRLDYEEACGSTEQTVNLTEPGRLAPLNARASEIGGDLFKAETKLREQLAELCALLFETGEPKVLAQKPFVTEAEVPLVMIPVESSRIKAYGYDPVNHILYTEWTKPGKAAPFGSYKEVSGNLFELFEKSASKGSFIHQQFSPENYDMRNYESLWKLPEFIGKS